MKKLLPIALAALLALGCSSQKATEHKMDRFVSELMSKMTLEEKIGQLNLPVAGSIVTGDGKSTGVETRIAN